MKKLFITFMALLLFSFCKAQIQRETDYIVIELGIPLDLRNNIQELYYDIDLFDDGIIDYKIIFNGHTDPLAEIIYYEKIIPYNGNSVGFNSIDSSFCQDTVYWRTHYTAINLLPGDSINDKIIFDTIPLSAFEDASAEVFHNGEMCYPHYYYFPSWEPNTPLKLSSGEKGYLETKVIIPDAYIILERIVLGTDIVLTDIPENLSTDYIKIYPNPSPGLIHLKYDKAFNEIQLITVSDLSGKILKHYQNLKSFPDIEILNCGYYLIKIQLDNEIIINKIIVL